MDEFVFLVQKQHREKQIFQHFPSENMTVFPLRLYGDFNTQIPIEPFGDRHPLVAIGNGAKMCAAHQFQIFKIVRLGQKHMNKNVFGQLVAIDQS